MINSKAFTILEILVVLAVAAIAVGTSWVSFKMLQPSIALRSAARTITVDLRYVQQLSVTEQVDYGIRFSSTTSQYSLLRYATTSQEFLTKSLPEGVAFQEITGFTDNEVVFNPYGAVREAGIISLVNTKQATQTIEVRPSGFVKIQD